MNALAARLAVQRSSPHVDEVQHPSAGCWRGVCCRNPPQSVECGPHGRRVSAHARVRRRSMLAPTLDRWDQPCVRMVSVSC